MYHIPNFEYYVNALHFSFLLIEQPRSCQLSTHSLSIFFIFTFMLLFQFKLTLVQSILGGKRKNSDGNVKHFKLQATGQK